MQSDFEILRFFIAAIFSASIYLLISNLIKKVFSIKMDLKLSPEQIHCSDGKGKITIDAVLYLSDDGKKPRILGIGKEPPNESYSKLNVFEFKNNSILESTEIIAAFFRTAFRQITKKKKFHPFIKARIRGIKNFESIFGQNAEEIIEKSLKEAFVIKCEFID